MRYRDNLPLVSANGIRMLYMLGTAIVLQLYLKELGASPFQISLLEVMFWGALFLFSPLWGALSDASGRRKIFLMASIFGAGMLIPVFGYIDTIAGVLVLRFVFSVVASAFPPVALAAMSASSSREHRAKDLAPYNTSRAVGFFLGWASSGILVDYLGFADAFVMFGVAGFIGFVATLFISRGAVDTPESVTFEEVWRKARKRWIPSRKDGTLKTHGLNYLYAGLFLRKAGLIGVGSLIAVYAVDILGIQTALMGLLIALNPLTQFVFITFFGNLTDVYGRRKVFLFGFLTTIPVPFILTVAANPVVFGAAYALLGFSFAALVEGSTAFIGDVAPKGRQGELMGFRKSSQGLAGVVGPLLAGALATLFNYRIMLYAMGGLMIAAFVLTLFETEESLHESWVHESLARDVVGRVQEVRR